MKGGRGGVPGGRGKFFFLKKNKILDLYHLKKFRFIQLKTNYTNFKRGPRNYDCKLMTIGNLIKL